MGRSSYIWVFLQLWTHLARWTKRHKINTFFFTTLVLLTKDSYLLMSQFSLEASTDTVSYNNPTEFCTGYFTQHFRTYRTNFTALLLGISPSLLKTRITSAVELIMEELRKPDSLTDHHIFSSSLLFQLN